MERKDKDSSLDAPASGTDIEQIKAILCPKNSAECIAAIILEASGNLRRPSRIHITERPDTTFAGKNPQALVEFLNGFLRSAVEKQPIDVHITAVQKDVDVRDRLHGQETDFADATDREVERLNEWLNLMYGAVTREFAQFVAQHGRSEAITIIQRLNELNGPGPHGTGLINRVRAAIKRRKLRMLLPREKLEKLFGITITIKELPDENTVGNLDIGYDHGSPGALIQEHIKSLESDRRAALVRTEDLKGFTYATLKSFLEKMQARIYTPLPLPPPPLSPPPPA